MQIILLVLSQDEALASTVHKVPVGAVPWYKEAPLHGATVGSLVFSVLLRAAHKNLVGARDVYLHSNTLAALANLAPHAASLAPHATHRLVAVIHTCGRRLRWLRGDRVRSAAALRRCMPSCRYAHAAIASPTELGLDGKPIAMPHTGACAAHARVSVSGLLIQFVGRPSAYYGGSSCVQPHGALERPALTSCIACSPAAT